MIAFMVGITSKARFTRVGFAMTCLVIFKILRCNVVTDLNNTSTLNFKLST